MQFQEVNTLEDGQRQTLAMLTEALEESRKRKPKARRTQSMLVALRQGETGEFIDMKSFGHDVAEVRNKAPEIPGYPVSRIMEVRVSLVKEVGRC